MTHPASGREVAGPKEGTDVDDLRSPARLC